MVKASAYSTIVCQASGACAISNGRQNHLEKEIETVKKRLSEACNRLVARVFCGGSGRFGKNCVKGV